MYDIRKWINLPDRLMDVEVNEVMVLMVIFHGLEVYHAQASFILV